MEPWAMRQGLHPASLSAEACTGTPRIRDHLRVVNLSKLTVYYGLSVLATSWRVVAVTHCGDVLHTHP